MQVAFRVDASREIGLGHFKRCLSLARALRDFDTDVVFVMRDLGFDPASELEAAACRLLRLPPVAADTFTPTTPDEPPHAAWAKAAASTDSAQTMCSLEHEGPDWVVVDHYAFDARWHRQVRNGLGCRIAVVDDVADRTLDAHVLIDHNHSKDHRAKYAGLLAVGTPILGGPNFALLGPGYANAPRYQFNAEVRSIGVFMGGADVGGFSAKAWEACRELAAFDGAIEIITTYSNPHLSELHAIFAADRRTMLSIGPSSLEAFYARHDIQVGAGGGATWERCCIGVPTVATAVATNQLSVLEPLRELGVLRISLPEPQLLGQEIKWLIQQVDVRHSLASRSRLLVDGLGSKRVASYLLESC